MIRRPRPSKIDIANYAALITYQARKIAELERLLALASTRRWYDRRKTRFAVYTEFGDGRVEEPPAEELVNAALETLGGVGDE
jgi:hypothetical protein